MEVIDSDESDFNNENDSGTEKFNTTEAWSGTRAEPQVNYRPLTDLQLKETNAVREFRPIVNLSIGGVTYVTRLATLRKYPDSMLATMFSGRHRIDQDGEGNYFIDRDGSIFSYILDFLRRGECNVKSDALAIYKEASYFGLSALTDKLLFHPDVCRETVKDAQKAQFPDYEGMKRKVIRAAIELASVSRVADVLIYVFRQTFQAKANSFDPKHDCVVNTAHVSIGPWDGEADEELFISCLEDDLLDEGFQLRPREARKKCKYYSGQSCQRYIYKLVFLFK